MAQVFTLPEIQDRLKELAKVHLEAPDTIQLDDDLVRDHGMDSIDHTDFEIALEETYDQKIQPRLVQEWFRDRPLTLRNISLLIAALQEKKAAID